MSDSWPHWRLTCVRKQRLKLTCLYWMMPGNLPFFERERERQREWHVSSLKTLDLYRLIISATHCWILVWWGNFSKSARKWAEVKLFQHSMFDRLEDPFQIWCIMMYFFVVLSKFLNKPPLSYRYLTNKPLTSFVVSTKKWWAAPKGWILHPSPCPQIAYVVLAKLLLGSIYLHGDPGDNGV